MNDIAKKLLEEFQSGRFEEFYKGSLDDYITGEHEQGTPEEQTNTTKVNEYVERLVERIISNN